MGAEQRKTLIAEIEKKRGSRLICCLTSDRDNAHGLIAKDFLFRFFQHLRQMEGQDKLEKLDVLLFTLGGDTLAAYALARLVRQFAKSVSVLVPYMCLSGGTLFSLCADEIVMTRLGVLSAIDPSIQGPLNPLSESTGPQQPGAPGAPIMLPGQRMQVPVAVESVAGFKKLTQDEWQLDKDGTAKAFSLLAEKVNPLLLGDLQRSKEQIVRLATSLMKLHSNPLDDVQIGRIVQTLATGLGSHDYLIGAPEAREVRLPVADEDMDLEKLILSLYEDFSEEMELGIPFDLGQAIQRMQQPTVGQSTQQSPSGMSVIVKIVMIESLQGSDTWEREFAVVPPNQVQIRRNHWRK